MGSNRNRGFSLIELLVVVIILAILVAIVVPSIISSQPERNLASASERFGLDVKYAMSVAQHTGNNVYIGFVGELDPRAASDPDLIEPRRNAAGLEIPGPLLGTSASYSFVNPGNPGLRRYAKRYYIIEERKRWRDEVLVGGATGPNYLRSNDGNLIPYTYMDWLNLYDAFQDGRTSERPIEPLFPYVGAPTGSSPKNPADGFSFNHTAAPRYVYPMDMRDGGANYAARLLTNLPIWAAGGRDDQAVKMFCVADTEEILAYDQAPIRRRPDGLRFAGPEDSPRLNDQIIDYVLLKEVDLPEHVHFLNPSRNYWVTDWQEVGGSITSLRFQDMQFLQHLWAFTPRGEVARAEWTYDSDGAPNVYVHGNVQIDRGLPQSYCFWMTTEEVVEDLMNGDSVGANPFKARKAQESMSGRIFVLWPLNGQYNVADYAPNDFVKPDLQQDLSVGGPAPSWGVLGGGGYIGNENVTARRERGYIQNFLAGRSASQVP